MCDNCGIGKEQSLVKNNTYKTLSSGMACSTSPVWDNHPLSQQLEAVLLNRVCTLQIVISLIDMVTKLAVKWKYLKATILL
jgi:hypothetical protein